MDHSWINAIRGMIITGNQMAGGSTLTAQPAARGEGRGAPAAQQAELAIYVSQACASCVYAQALAQRIRWNYPHVHVQVIDLAAVDVAPAQVFATPTYLLDGRVWSLGNPSDRQIEETFGPGRGQSQSPAT